MFKRILIANRGEIACRVIKTAQRLGIETVAIYSEVDEGALHVLAADKAISVGSSVASESYLSINKIVDIALETGSEAVHPGYGFLSENYMFAEALQDKGIKFIGPSAKAISSMGDKIESKKIAKLSGVNTIPGAPDALSDVDEAFSIAEKIGYPVMIKAAAGGGGKGMRLAYSKEEISDSVQSAINEATTSFGDGRVFVEKFIEQPRHIEIQILADSFGNVIHLGERECSIQRRHQKVIEEAPSSFLDQSTRNAMGSQACRLASAVDYTSAGTVEFVVDKDKNFYFLEMNTRLQVEHPVTEFITGYDLVEEQIKIANGQALSIKQSDVKINGWSIEARIYAEDPTRGFTPSIGRLVRHKPPEETNNVRVDSGVIEGSEISIFYDPMISKLITFGKDRDSAISSMLNALDSYIISGITHNISLLSAIVNNDRFRSGDLTTNFMDEEFSEGFSDKVFSEKDLEKIIPVSGFIANILMDKDGIIDNKSNDSIRDLVLFIGELSFKITVRTISLESIEVSWGNQSKPVNVKAKWIPHKRLIEASINGDNHLFQIYTQGSTGFVLSWRSFRSNIIYRTDYAAQLMKKMPKKEPPDLSQYLLSPMPGLVVSIPVKEGETIDTGQPLIVVDAMKMENILRAERECVVKKILVSVGDSLSVDEIIMEFK
tara:strand:- start:46327 stop:48312 length:1986 start_codon:yes stop_codon:yes gene_type:complete